MTDQRPSTPLDVYPKDMMLAVRAGFHHSALALALALPDICASIEYPPDLPVGDRYRRWCDTWGKILTISGTDCYALRCAYLHSGSEEFSGRSAQRALFERIEFTVGQVDGVWLSQALPPASPGGKQAARIPVEQFCQEMATAVDAWRRERGTDARVAAAIAELLWMRPAG
jgi:hypothetical protein